MFVSMRKEIKTKKRVNRQVFSEKGCYQKAFERLIN